MAASTAPAAHYYEVALYADFPPHELQPILNRLQLNCPDAAVEMHAREVFFEPLDARRQPHSHQSDSIVPLKARRDLLNTEDDTWILFYHLKPESERIYPEVTVRPWTTLHVSGDALSLASALGYARTTQSYKRGYAFRRGNVVIHVFQQEQVDPDTGKPSPPHPETLWEVEVKTASPVEVPRIVVPEILQVQRLMKGLLDLRKKDA